MGISEALKKNIQSLEECIHILEGNGSDVPSEKARSNSGSPVSPVHYHPLPWDKKLEAKLQGIESVVTGLENHIDSQILILNRNIEQLHSVRFQICHFQKSHEHMTTMYSELSRAFSIHYEK